MHGEGKSEDDGHAQLNFVDQRINEMHVFPTYLHLFVSLVYWHTRNLYILFYPACFAFLSQIVGQFVFIFFHFSMFFYSYLIMFSKVNNENWNLYSLVYGSMEIYTDDKFHVHRAFWN